MKAGASKVKLYAAVVLSIGAVMVVAWTLIPHGSHDETQSVAPRDAAVSALAPSDSLDPRLHLELLASAEGVKYEGSGKNIFRSSEEDRIERVKVPPLLGGIGGKGAPGAAPVAAQPPGPPPINMKYFGLASGKGENPKAFLSQGDNVWIAKEGDVVNRHYKIVRISPREVEIEDLLNSHRESVPLAQS
jgi:hypothetical protein